MEEAQKRHVGLIVFTIVVLLYFCSEAVLRRSSYQTIATAKVDTSAVINKLPTFVKSPVEQLIKVDNLEKAVEQAETPQAKLKALFDLSGQVSEGRQRKLYVQICEEFPTNPQIARAWASRLDQFSEDKAVDHYLTFAAGCEYANGNQRIEVWRAGYAQVSSYATDPKYRFLEAFAEHKLVHSSLVSAYEELRMLSSRKGNRDLNVKAKGLYEKCDAAQRAEMMRKR